MNETAPASSLSSSTGATTVGYYLTRINA